MESGQIADYGRLCREVSDQTQSVGWDQLDPAERIALIADERSFFDKRRCQPFAKADRLLKGHLAMMTLSECVEVLRKNVKTNPRHWLGGGAVAFVAICGIAILGGHDFRNSGPFSIALLENGPPPEEQRALESLNFNAPIAVAMSLTQSLDNDGKPEWPSEKDH